MIDCHCHLDLFQKPLAVYEEIKRRETYVFAVTTSPRAYLKSKKYLPDTNRIHIALGFHPELVGQRSNEIDLFVELMSTTRFIGEVGIDGSQSLKDSYDIQKAFFIDVVKESEKLSDKVISIHSRHASKDVVNILKNTSGNNKYILHWFTGTRKEAKTALDCGCWFSINPKMCLTSSGRSIISELPIDRIIPETDSPFVTHNNQPYMPWDLSVINYLSKVYGLQTDKIIDIMKANFKTLMREV